LDPLKLLRRVNEQLERLPSFARAMVWVALWVATVAFFLSFIKLGFLLLALSTLLGIERASRTNQPEMVILLIVVFAATVFTVCSAFDWFIIPGPE